MLALLLSLAPAGPARARAQLPELLAARGVQAYRAGKLELAERLLDEACRRRPRLSAAGHYLGLAKIRLGRLKEGRRVLARAARRDPNNARLRFDLGLAYLKEGNAAWAARALRAARDLEPGNGRTRYQLGLALLRLGHPEAALRELRAARHEPGIDWETMRMQLGLAQYQAGRWAASREMVGPLVWHDRHDAAAARLLRASYHAEGTDASWVSGQVTLAPVYDSNPFYLIQEQGSSTDRTSSPPGVGPQVSGALTLRPYVGARTLLSADLSGSRTFYFAAREPRATERDPRDASPTLVHAGAAFTRRFPLKAGVMALTAGYAFDLTFLDGTEDTDEHHIFVEEHTGRLALSYRPAGRSCESTVSYNLIRSAFADLSRTSWGNQLQLEHVRPLGARANLLAWLGLRHEAAQSDDYDAFIPGLGAGLSYLAPAELVLGLRVGYEHENHYSSASGRWSYGGDRGGVSIQRLDNTLTATAEVGKALFRGLRLRAVYQRLQNLSTVSQFAYSRDLVSLNLIWSP